MVICVCLLFPLPRIFGINRSKKILKFIIHIVVITYSLFTVFCLFHIFRLDVIDLPSGEQAGMTAAAQLMLGRHYNLTGMIAATMFFLSIYMIFADDNWFIRFVYVFFVLVHLIVIYLCNSRTVFVGVLTGVVFLSFFISWKWLYQTHFLSKILMCLLITASLGTLFWYGRYWAFDLFELGTNFSERLAETLGNSSYGIHGSQFLQSLSSRISDNSSASFLSGDLKQQAVALSNSNTDVRALSSGLSFREYIWIAALKVLASDKNTLIFGVTPVQVPNMLQTIGGYWTEAAHAHNSVLQTGVSMGVPAMVFFLSFVLLISIRCVYRSFCSSNSKTFVSIAVSAGLLCFIVISMAEAYLSAYFSIMSCAFFSLSGYISAIDDEENEKHLLSLKSRNIIRTVVILTAVLVCVGMVGFTLNDLNIDSSRIRGNGTKWNPYLIEDSEDFTYFSKLVNHGNRFEGKYFLQTSDIVIKDTDWKPIGTYKSKVYFAGNYNGGGYSVVIDNENQDIFEYLRGSVYQLKFGGREPLIVDTVDEDNNNLLSDAAYYIEKDRFSKMVCSTTMSLDNKIDPQSLVNKELTLSIFVNSPGGRTSYIADSSDYMRHRFGCHYTMIWLDDTGNNEVRVSGAVNLLSQEVNHERIYETFTVVPPEGCTKLLDILVAVQAGACPSENNEAIWALGYPRLEIND